MFKITQSPEFWQEVAAEVTDENGKRVPIKFDVRFRRMTQSAVTDLLAEHRASGKTDSDFVKAVAVNWRGVTGDQGEEVPFTPESLDAVCEAGLATAIVYAFFKGQPKAREKN